ncbi:MAG: DUF4417 domain-containing protein [Mollicutes bacterium]|nr:DUF4417 domain-containing protein [Mollicutes bacterium]
MPNYLFRDNFKDIFGVYLLESLSFDGDFDMPVVGNFDDISEIDYIALYSDKKEYNKTNNTCVAFYQYDHVFDGIHGLYNSIIYKDESRLEKFRERFKDVKYIAGPDYSLFGDFPNALQIFNVYKSRVCIRWLTINTNAKVIPNVRWTHPFTFEYCFDGISKGSNISVGALGQIRNKDNKKMFLDGLREAVDRIAPKYILVYGFINEDNFDEFFGYAKSKGTKIVIPHSKIDRYKKESSIYGWR